MQTLAELSIAVVGFTGIIAVYQRVNHAQGELARWRVYTVLTSSLTALLFSTLPIGLVLVGVATPSLWRLCSGALVVAYAVVYADLLRTRKRLSKPSLEILEAHPWYTRTLGGLASVLVGLLVLNATSLFFRPSAGLYYFGVLGIITIACTIFGRTVFGPQPSEPSPPA